MIAISQSINGLSDATVSASEQGPARCRREPLHDRHRQGAVAPGDHRILNEEKMRLPPRNLGGTLEVWKDRTETVKTGDEKITIEKGSRTHSVKADDKLSVESGNREITIKAGNDTTKVSAGKSSTEAMQSIELTVGSNSIKIDQTGVTIKGIMVTIEGQAMLEAKAPMATVKGDGMLTLKGGITMIN